MMRRRGFGCGRSGPRSRVGGPEADVDRCRLAARPLVVAAVVAALSVIGCGNSGDSGPGDASDESSESATEGGTCVGTPAPCESFYDYDSCQQQGGCGWVFAYYECRNDMVTGPTCAVLSGRVDVCLGQVGCRWE